MRREFAVGHVVAENVEVAVVELLVFLSLNSLSAAALFALIATTARSNIAFASAGVPDCWALADPALNNIASATCGHKQAPVHRFSSG